MDNQIGDKGAEFLSHALARNSRLTSLDLKFNQIGDKGVARYIEQYLTANHKNRPSTPNPPAVTNDTQLPTLQPLPTTTLPTSFNLPSLSAKLTYLNLTNNRIDDSVIAQLVAACKAYPQLALTQLLLAKNTITTTGLKQLAQKLIPKLPRLSHLNLADNDCDEFSLAVLIDILAQWNPLLQYLDISGNALGDTGMQILADYLETNTSLQFLGVRDTCFSEAVGYRRFMKCFNKNYTLVAVDMSGNLLLSRTAQTTLTQILKRNQKLQPDITRLQKEQSAYLAQFKQWVEQMPQMSQVLARQEVSSLNVIYALLQRMQQLWHDRMEGPYSTINLAIKKQGNNESHSLLAAVNETQKQQRELDKSYQQLKAQLSQAAYYPAWQRNRATIRIWESEFTKGQVGHVAVATANSYLSLWPAKTPSVWQTFTAAGVAATFNRLEDDEKAEGPDGADDTVKWLDQRRKVADKIIVLFSLSSQEIEEKIQTLFNLGHEYGLINKSKWGSPPKGDRDKQLGNCCDKASAVIQSQIEQLTGKLLSRQFGIATPAAILSWVEKAKQEELSRYPHTKDLNTLRSEEQVLGKVYPAAIVVQPSAEMQRTYSERGLFFGFKRRANAKLSNDLVKQWSTTPHKVYVITKDYQTVDDNEVALKAGDLIEELTPVLNTGDFIKHVPDVLVTETTGRLSLPGWVHFMQVHSATVVLQHDIPGTALKKDTELKLIGKYGSLDNDNSVVICQQDTFDGVVKHSLRRHDVRFLKLKN